VGNGVGGQVSAVTCGVGCVGKGVGLRVGCAVAQVDDSGEGMGMTWLPIEGCVVEANWAAWFD
jgi:hypothetical protein